MAETKAYNEVFNYLRDNEYPIDFSKDQKRNLRKKAIKYVLEDGALFFIGPREKARLKDGFIAKTSSRRYWKLVTLTNLLGTLAVTRREKRFVQNSMLLVLNFKIVDTIYFVSY